MPYRLNDRLDHLGSRMSQINGEVMYLSDDFDNPTFMIELSGVSRGRTEGDLMQTAGPSIQVYLIDFFVDTDQLTLDGATFLPPREGYHLKAEDGAIYRIVAGPMESPAWNYTTPSKRRVRIHTTQHGEA